jgi:hypothetical protein
MKNLLLAATAIGLFAVIPLSSSGCGPAAPGGGAGGGSGGGTSGAGGGMAAVQRDTPAKISAFLEGKKLTMAGADLPTHPNGLNENVYFGASTQCYNNTVIDVASGNFNVTAQLGTWRSLDGGTPMAGTVGQCDRATVSGPFSATSTAVLIQNVKGNAECFDIDVTFNSYAQEGRGSIEPDGAKVKLELYFKNGAVNNRCADGNPGATGVKQVVMGTQYPFTGNAVQSYAVSAQ